MTPIALSDDALREIMAAGQLVPVEQRGIFLERVAAELASKEVGPGVCHRTAWKIARSIVWSAGAAACRR